MKANNLKWTKRTILIFCLVFGAGFAGAAPKDTVNVVLNVDPTSLNMLEFKTGVELIPVLHMHSMLMSSDLTTGEYTINTKDGLAKSVTIMENGKDLKIVLKKGFRFHTGDPVTADDVRFTYEQCIDPVNSNIMAGPLDEIEEIEVLDDYTLILRFYEPYAAWKDFMWVGIASEKYYEKVGRKRFRSHPVGSGPFRFVERRVGEYIILEANEEHIEAPAFKRLKFWVIPDSITRISMLKAGEVDLISRVLPHDAKRLRQSGNITVKSESRVPSLYAISGKQENYPITKDPKLGLAISMAINRQEIVDKIFMGEGYPLYTFASRIELGYDPDYKIEYNLKKARELLRQSSYKPGTPLVMSYSEGDVPMASMIATIVQRYLRELGVTLELKQLEYGVKATYARNKDPREGHFTLYQWDGGRDPSIRLKMTLPRDSSYSSYTSRPRQQEVDELTYAQGREMNVEKRKAILKKLHGILRQDSSGAILFGLNMIYAMNNRIEYTWVPKMAGLNYLHHIKIVQ